MPVTIDLTSRQVEAFKAACPDDKRYRLRFGSLTVDADNYQFLIDKVTTFNEKKARVKHKNIDHMEAIIASAEVVVKLHGLAPYFPQIETEATIIEGDPEDDEENQELDESDNTEVQ